MILIASERAILSRAIDVIDKPSRNPLDHRYVFAGGNPVSFVELDGHRYIVADGVYAHSITGKIVEDRRSGSNGSKSSSNEGELSSYVCIQAGCNEGNLVYPAYPPVYWEVPKAELTPEERLFLEGLSFALAVAEPSPVGEAAFFGIFGASTFERLASRFSGGGAAGRGGWRVGTGTVWDSIKSTQPAYSGTVIPKSFELTVNNSRFWVHPNATTTDAI